jgi:hypothetical protein
MGSVPLKPYKGNGKLTGVSIAGLRPELDGLV